MQDLSFKLITMIKNKFIKYLFISKIIHSKLIDELNFTKKNNPRNSVSKI